MKTIVAGSRSIVDYAEVKKACDACPWEITEVVSGTARGVDRLGERWADDNGIPIRRFPADWDRYGKRAGYIRNAQMADYAEALVMVYDGSSRGSQMMWDIAVKRGLLVTKLVVTAL